jgi:hypothetical protein
VEDPVRVSVFFEKKVQDWALGGLALVLFFSPWLIGFATSFAAWCAWFASVFLAYLGVAASLSQGEHWEEWATAMLGVGLIFAPWLLGFGAGANADRTFWLVGALTVVISIWADWLHWHPYAPQKQ